MDRIDSGVVEHVQVMWQHRWKVLLAALVVGFAVGGIRMRAEDRYEARAEVRLALRDAGANPDATADYYVDTYARLAESPPALAAALSGARLSLSLEEAARSLEVRPSPTVGYLSVRASSPRPTEAAQLADALADVLVALVATDQAARVGPAERPLVTAELARRASTPTAPLGPEPARQAAVAFAVAFLCVAEAVVLVRWLRGGLSLAATADQASELAGVPAAAFSTRRRRVVAPTAFLRARVVRDGPVVVVGVPARAAAVVGVQIAAVAADRSRDTLLVDAAVQGPAIHREAGLAAGRGLSEVLAHRAELSEVALRAADRVVLVTAGKPGLRQPAPEEVLGIRRVVASSGAEFSVLVVGAPEDPRTAPLLELPGARVVLAVDPLLVTAARLRRAVGAIRDLGGDLVAVVAVPPGRSRTRTRRALADWPWVRRDLATRRGAAATPAISAPAELGRDNRIANPTKGEPVARAEDPARLDEAAGRDQAAGPRRNGLAPGPKRVVRPELGPAKRRRP